MQCEAVNNSEGEGFEPSIPCGILAFQASALDQTMRPLHSGNKCPLQPDFFQFETPHACGRRLILKNYPVESAVAITLPSPRHRLLRNSKYSPQRQGSLLRRRTKKGRMPLLSVFFATANTDDFRETSSLCGPAASCGCADQSPRPPRIRRAL